jgi:anti-sigma factor RsiW
MMAMKKMLEQEPSEIEMLLPWHATGTLNPRDAKRVEEALAHDPALATQYAAIREEYADTIGLNESLGAPPARAMAKLFAAIDDEPERKPSASAKISAGVTGFFARLSPRTLAWTGSLGALVVVLQAGVIGSVLMQNQPASYRTASLSMNEPITRALGPAAQPRALVRFAPDARIADINALLEHYQADIVDARGGMFRLQFGNKAISKDDNAALMNKLQSEKIVSLAVATP